MSCHGHLRSGCGRGHLRVELRTDTMIEAFAARAVVLGPGSLRRKPLLGSQGMCVTAALHPDEVRA